MIENLTNAIRILFSARQVPISRLRQVLLTKNMIWNMFSQICFMVWHLCFIKL